MSRDIPYLFELKTLAKTLRRAKGVSHSRALEEIAHRYQFRDWNTLVAAAGPQPPVFIGQKVAGRYLKVPFRGKVLSVRTESRGMFRVNIHFDELIDVVAFKSFTNLKNRANKVLDVDGVSIDRTSDGIPHMTLKL